MRSGAVLAAVLCGAFAFLESPAGAQRGMPGAELVNSATAARRMLIKVGAWAAARDDGAFYFRFRSNGTFTYTHIDQTKVIRAQQAGAFDVRGSRRNEPRWPSVSGPGADQERGRGFLLVLRPTTFEVPSSDPPDLPGDEQGEYRLTFSYDSPDATAMPLLHLLSAAQPPDNAFGHLRLQRGP